MARPEPWRLNPASYPFGTPVQTRFQDLDVLGHLNNVAVAALFESGRVRFNMNAGFAGPGGTRWLVAQVIVNYLAEGHFPADVEVRSGIGHVGTRSWQIMSAAFQAGACIATCDVVVVLSAEGGATSLPDPLRARLEEWRAADRG